LVDAGRRIARLHEHTLRNDYGPWGWRSLGDGRFLVTKNDRFPMPGSGLTENALVIYDFVRGTSVARRIEDFLPADVREKLRPSGLMEGPGWSSGPGWFDAERLLYYINDPENCRDLGYPFLIVDLRSHSVQTAPVPDHFPG